jgi:hypothetical protein
MKGELEIIEYAQESMNLMETINHTTRYLTFHTRNILS